MRIIGSGLCFKDASTALSSVFNVALAEALARASSSQPAKASQAGVGSASTSLVAATGSPWLSVVSARARTTLGSLPAVSSPTRRMETADSRWQPCCRARMSRLELAAA
jgi:hypothetical protein